MFIWYNINISNREVSNLKRIDLIKKLRKAGYKPDRNNSHEIFEAPGKLPVSVPNHKEINENTAREILKKAGL